MSDNEFGRDPSTSPDDQSVPEQSEPMSMADDMGEPNYDVAGVALGAVFPEEAAAVREAAASDPAVAAELARMREVVADLSLIEPLEMINRGRSAGMRSRLLARAAASPAGRRGRAPARQSPLVVAKDGGRAEGVAATGPRVVASPVPAVHVGSRRGGSGSRALGWLALAASIAFAVTATQLWRVSRDHQQLTGAVASREGTLMQRVNELQAAVQTKDSLIGALTGTRTRVIDLASYSSLNPVAKMFWDQKTQEWTLYASNLERPPAGKTYQLWLIASGHRSPISAGTFTPDSSGAVVMHAKYGLEPGTLRRIAVTEEPAGGVDAPTGRVVFAGVGR